MIKKYIGLQLVCSIEIFNVILFIYYIKDLFNVISIYTYVTTCT